MGKFFSSVVDEAINYVQYLAWLDAIPDGAKESRRSQYVGTEYLEVEPEFNYSWLINLALDCGLYESTDSGLTGISWQNINAWKQINNIDTWSANVVKRISNEYVSYYYKSRDKFSDSPLEQHREAKRKVVAGEQQLKAFLLSRKK